MTTALCLWVRRWDAGGEAFCSLPLVERDLGQWHRQQEDYTWRFPSSRIGPVVFELTPCDVNGRAA